MLAYMNIHKRYVNNNGYWCRIVCLQYSEYSSALLFKLIKITMEYKPYTHTHTTIFHNFQEYVLAYIHMWFCGSSTHTWLNLSQFEAAFDHKQLQGLEEKCIYQSKTLNTFHLLYNWFLAYVLMGEQKQDQLQRIKKNLDLVWAVSKSVPCGLTLNTPQHSRHLLPQCLSIWACNNGQQWFFNTPYKPLDVLILVLLPPTKYIHIYIQVCTWLCALVRAHSSSTW